MKKIFIALVTLTLVFGLSAIAYATDGDQNTYQVKAQKHMGEMKITPPAIGTLTPPAIRNMKTTPPAFGLNLEAKTTLAAIRAHINKNREEINAARLLIKDELASIKLDIKELREDGTPLTETEITSIKAALQSMKEDRKAYNDEHKARIEAQKIAVKGAHGTKDLSPAIAAMNKIITEQEERLLDLANFLTELKKISLVSN